MKVIEGGGITSPKGYRAAGIAAGIKKAKKDIMVIVSDYPAQAAGAFTTNVVKAAPVLFDKQVVTARRPVYAIVANSGNANACTGNQGILDVQAMAETAAKALNESYEAHQILVCSTGVIGQPLPMDKVVAGIKTCVEALGVGKEADDTAAAAILTTDTFKKEYVVEIELFGKPVRIAGIAKGSGMIHPNMATMLSFVVTDANISAALLQQLVGTSIVDTYNMISVDGDTSTNDTFLVLANGASGTEEILGGTEEAAVFSEALNAVNAELAKLIIRDGEGAGKFIEVRLKGAVTKVTARLLAKSVITSSLVKTAFFGADANWGRVLSALGASGIEFDPMQVGLSFSSNKGSIELLRSGEPVAFDEAKAKEILLERDIIVDVTMGEGTEEAVAWGCDLSYDYVRINGDYRS